ncbi:MAG: hypothetical protein KDB68_02665 [Planctomycetes bacterium]|nr:hypothetical protein [Planctomycetota bacterium]
MRYFPFVILLLMVGCSSQRRDYDSDPWRDYEPRDDRTTYDETYIPPSRMNADQLVDRALRAERDGRDDQARVDYQQAFRRDRWHPPANERYQDLMLRNGLFDDVWQEYLDQWQQNPMRGDAFWYHVRPMLERRAESPLPLEREKKLTPEQRSEIQQLRGDAARLHEEGNDTEALVAVNKALEIAGLPDLHRLRIDLSPPEDYDALLSEYAERAEENPASGDALYLHAHVLAFTDAPAALGLLRDSWVIEVPGFWLRFGLAEVCRDLGDAELQPGIDGDTDAARSAAGWYAAAEAFARRCLTVEQQQEATNALLDYAMKQLGRLP